MICVIKVHFKITIDCLVEGRIYHLVFFNDLVIVLKWEIVKESPILVSRIVCSRANCHVVIRVYGKNF